MYENYCKLLFWFHRTILLFSLILCFLFGIFQAFVGFSFGPPICGIATGNWGCGVFCGNAELKALLQVMAAGQTGRDLAYFTFKDDKLRDSIYKMYKFLCDKGSTVGMFLLKYLFCFALLLQEFGRFVIKNRHVFELNKSLLLMKNL